MVSQAEVRARAKAWTCRELGTEDGSAPRERMHRWGKGRGGEEGSRYHGPKLLVDGPLDACLSETISLLCRLVHTALSFSILGIGKGLDGDVVSALQVFV